MRPVCRSAGKEMPQNPRQWGQYAADVTRPWNQGKEGASESTLTLLGLSLALLSINICQPPDVDFVPGSTTVTREWEQHCRGKQRRKSLLGVTMVLWWPMPAPHSRQSSLSYFPFFSWPAHPRCTQLDPRSRLTFIPAWHLAPVETGPSLLLLVPADLAAFYGSFNHMLWQSPDFWLHECWCVY